MTPAILGAAIKFCAGVMPGAIEDPKVRIRKMRGQPLGADQCCRICRVHALVSLSENAQMSPLGHGLIREFSDPLI